MGTAFYLSHKIWLENYVRSSAFNIPPLIYLKNLRIAKKKLKNDLPKRTKGMFFKNFLFNLVWLSFS